MSKKLQLLVLTLAMWSFSAYFANNTDWFQNLTPPMHLFVAAWFGFMSIVLGLLGIVMLGRYLYCSFNNKEMGISSRYN